MSNKTMITIAIFACGTITGMCYFNHKTEVHKQEQETERALKQDKKTTIDFGFGKKDK